VFSFLVLLVSSQVYHLCSLLLITNCKALLVIGLMDLQWWEIKEAWTKSSGSLLGLKVSFVLKKKVSTLFRFCVFGKSISIKCHCV